MSMFLTSSLLCVLMVVFVMNYLTGVSSSTYVVEPSLQDLQIDICAQRRSFAVSSFQDCAYSCLVQDYCVSFFFNLLTLTCQLHITVFRALDVNLATDLPGNIYYYLKSWEPPPSDFGFNNTIGLCVHLHLEPMIWDDASVICSKEGAHLVTIDTDDKQAYLAEFMKDQPNVVFPFYIGARFKIDEWVWQDNTIVQSFNWCGTSGTDKKCMVVRSDQCWASRRCDRTHQFVCEI